MRLHRWLIPIAALLALTPLIVGGPSCGKDSIFHFQSWLDAAAQFRHGTLYPRWNFLAAYNAGEPRFVFYPPVSWYLGGLLTLLLPFQAVPVALAWIALCVAGFTMHRLVAPWASPAAALLSACLYLANPFMLFSLLARDAYGELFAAAFCPLLIQAALEEAPTPWAIAFALALMWLSNVPGGVIGAYLLVLLATIRIVLAWRSSSAKPGKLFLVFAAGFVLTFACSAFYLLPAIHQRPLIHVTAAFPPGLRTTDNLFFQRTLIPPFDTFLIQLGHLALSLIAITALAFFLAWSFHRKQSQPAWSTIGIPIAIVTAVLSFFLTAPSAVFWRTLPELWLVQFPWRLLFVLAACMALAIALCFRTAALNTALAVFLSLLLVLALSIPLTRLYRFGCSLPDTALGIRTRLLNHHSFEPTDEYVVATGDAGFLRPDNPPHWLAAHPNDYAPNTTPNLANIVPDAQMPAVPDNAQLSATELHFLVNSPRESFLVVNLQDYPNWRVTQNNQPVNTRLSRPEGLLTIPLPPGPSTIDISWHHSWDEVLGAVISTLTLAFRVAFKLREARL